MTSAVMETCSLDGMALVALQQPNLKYASDYALIAIRVLQATSGLHAVVIL